MKIHKNKNIVVDLVVYKKLLDKKNKIISDTGKSPSFSEIIGDILQ